MAAADAAVPDCAAASKFGNDKAVQVGDEGHQSAVALIRLHWRQSKLWPHSSAPTADQKHLDK